VRVARLGSALREDPGGAVFLALLLAVATVTPALNQAVPASSPLHLSSVRSSTLLELLELSRRDAYRPPQTACL